ELREALGGARDVARFAFRLADPHVLVRGVVAGRGRDGVRHVHRLPGRGGDLGSDGPVGAVPHRARLDDAFGGEADAVVGTHRLGFPGRGAFPAASGAAVPGSRAPFGGRAVHTTETLLRHR